MRPEADADLPSQNLTFWYTTAALTAVGGMIAGAPSAQAGLVSFTSDATTEAVSQVYVYVDFVTGTVTGPTASINAPTSWALALSPGGIFANPNGPTVNAVAVTTSYTFATPLGAGVSVGSGTAGFAPVPVAGVGADLVASSFGWTPGQAAYVGLQFPAAGGANYGWLELVNTGDGNNDLTVLGGAYDTTLNQAVTTPEPASLVLLASGVVGLAAYRARRSARNQRAAAAI